MPTTNGPDPAQALISLAVAAVVLLVHLVLASRALADLSREDRRVRRYSRQVWTIVIVLAGIIGPLYYLSAGRENEW